MDIREKNVKTHFKNMGVGVGLRPSHYSVFLNELPKSIKWIEVISENFMPWKGQEKFGESIQILKQLRKDFPVCLHGVSMNLGSTDDLDLDYLNRLKILIQEMNPEIVSDHLSWTGVNRKNMHDLLPLPYMSETLNLLVEKIDRVQDFLGRQILIENPSSYLEYKISDRSEPDFISELLEKTGAGLLLDINNVYVSSINHGFDAKKYLLQIPSESVGQIHLAGHSQQDDFLIDTHDANVCDDVWDLYKWYIDCFGKKSVMIERDGNIPEWQELEKELMNIGRINDEVQKSSCFTEDISKQNHL